MRGKKGKVLLVGAGPGDEKLITVRGMEAVQKADVVVYDNLAPASLLKNVKPGCEVIYAGKQSSRHTLTQKDIQKLLVKKAREGKNVVRLKGGDPFVFGRGGEEAEELLSAGIRYEVIPGITAGVACAAYAGIPVTHRDFTSGVAFFTGHEKPGKQSSSLYWDKISTGVGTLVFYMGMENLPFIAENLILHGRRPETPVALIHKGTTAGQKTVTGTLKNIVSAAKKCGMKPPVIIIVGEVVSLRKKLSWFENKSLFGKRILVTRAREQASELTEKLTARGAGVLEVPMLRIKPVKNSTQIKHQLKKMPSYEWLIFTSVNGVHIFMQHVFKNGYDARILGSTKIACIGDKTADALKPYGLHADKIPKEFVAEKLAARFTKKEIENKNILLARAREARDVLPRTLKKRGADVTVLPLYDTVIEKPAQQDIKSILEEKPVDAITFASSSTVKNFVSVFKKDAFRISKNACVACIGPVTAQTCREAGIPVSLVAKKHTMDGLVAAIENYFYRKK